MNRKLSKDVGAIAGYILAFMGFVCGFVKDKKLRQIFKRGKDDMSESEKITDRRVIELIEIAEKLLRFCIENHLSIRREQTAEQLAIKAVYDIILELAAASQLMMNNRYCVNSAALLRSLFEYNVELHWLIENIENPDKIQKRILDARLEQKKIANEIANSTHECFKDIKRDPRFNAQKNNLKPKRKVILNKVHSNFVGICRTASDIPLFTVHCRKMHIPI